MNRLDTTIVAGTLQDAGVTTLSPKKLESWDAKDFALAIELARAPVAFRSGLGEALLHLMVDDGATENVTEDVLAILPINIDDNTLALGLGHNTLDTLVSLLSGEISRGVGANISLDAIEALCVAVLSPVDRIEVGRASWGQPETSIAALKLDSARISLAGEPDAILALQSAVVASNASLPSPFASLGQPLPQRLAVTTENVFAVVHLSEADRAAVEPGCGIMLDVFWQDGRKIAGHRFVKSGLEWQIEQERKASCIHVRSTAQLQLLDELSLDVTEADPSPTDLELMDHDQLIARGRLTTVEISGTPHMVFQVDQLV